MCESSKWDFADLHALFLNCALKPSSKESHTEDLLNVSRDIFDANDVKTELLRPVNYDIAPGVYPDMTEKGFATDDWPEIQHKVLDADILVIGSPIWLGEKSSVCTRVIERLYDCTAIPAHCNQRSEWKAGCRFDHPNSEHW